MVIWSVSTISSMCLPKCLEWDHRPRSKSQHRPTTKWHDYRWNELGREIVVLYLLIIFSVCFSKKKILTNFSYTYLRTRRDTANCDCDDDECLVRVFVWKVLRILFYYVYFVVTLVPPRCEGWGAGKRAFCDGWWMEAG